jgi:hypothetical protein
MYLHGFTTVQDQSTYLTESVSAAATTLKVADTTAMSRGLVEIGDELLMVDAVDTVSLNMQVPPYGRGFRGTTAATHASGSRVVSAPMFPRYLVKNAINETVRAVFPDLFGVASTTLTFTPAVSTYALPSGALDVLGVSWSVVGPSKEWMPVRRYRVDKMADTTEFASGVTVSLYDAIVPGRSVRIVYTKQPTALSAADDVFTTVTGLPASCEDVIRLGAAARMIPFFDAAHLSGMSAEADFSANMRPVGGSSSLGKYLMQLYQVRLAEETKRLQSLYPNRSHYTR